MPGLYEGLYSVRDDIAEVYRRLAYELDRFWDLNDEAITKLTRTYKIAASALVIEILSLTVLLGDSIFQVWQPNHKLAAAELRRLRLPLFRVLAVLRPVVVRPARASSRRMGFGPD